MNIPFIRERERKKRGQTWLEAGEFQFLGFHPLSTAMNPPYGIFHPPSRMDAAANNEKRLLYLKKRRR
jgi:hypothetical protein